MLLSSPELAPLHLLHHVEGPAASFLAVDPRLVLPSYRTVLGAAGFSGFGNSADLSAANDLGLGVDASGNGGFQLDDNAPAGNDRQANHSSIFGASSAYTLEAMVKLPAGMTTGQP